MGLTAETTLPADRDRLIALLESYISEFIDKRPLPGNLRQAIRYALLGSGKRMRPLLTMYCCRAVGGDAEQALPAAAAIEMVHCFSLVHDDLPAMDDDDLRRGRPTLHKHTDEAMAILAGDAMLGLAFEIIATLQSPAELAGPISCELAVAANDMISGQVYDTFHQFDESTEPMEQLRTIHRNKTAALIRCACRMGAITGGGDEKQLDAITDYAQAIGLMFQVVDDVLDVTQSTEHLGKTAGKDVEQDKLTYPALIGLDASREEILRLQNQANKALMPLQDAAKPLKQLCDYMAVRTH